MLSAGRVGPARRFTMTELRSDSPEGTQARLRRDFFESVHDAIVVFRPADEVVIDVNRRACELYGIDRAEFIGRSLKSMTANVAAGEAQIAETLEFGHTRGFESVHVRPDGTRMFLEINAAAIVVEGRPAVMSVNRDVTDRRRVENALKQHVEQLALAQSIDRDVVAGEPIDVVARRALERLIQRIPGGRGGVSTFDVIAGTAEVLATAGVYVERLAPGRRLPLADWTDFDELSRRPVRYVPHLGTPSNVGELLEALHQSGLRSALTLTLSSMGETFGEVTLSSPDDDAFDDAFVGFARAIADELAVALREAKLRADLTAERERLGILVQHLPEGVVLLDATGHVQLANETGRELLDVLAARSTGDAITTLGAHSLSALVAAAPARVEVIVEQPVRRVLDVAARRAGGSGGHVLVLREVTVEHDLRARLREHDRLAAVGRLAAGIAHDFNNLLQVVATCSELALDGAESPSVVREQVGAVVEQTRRGAALIRQILDFSRRSVATFRPVDMGALLRDVVTMLRHSIPETVRIVLDVAPGVHTVRADATQIHQVLTNLALNARDAMPQGGTLRVGVEGVRLGDGDDARSGSPPRGSWVCVRVSDEGTGIPPDVLPHVFEPFFTTKRPGEGTGLGLSQVYGIVKQHEGTVGVESSRERGTTFSLYFPATEEEIDDAPGSDRALVAGAAQGVLVVEDDPVLRRSLAKLVTTIGYRALTASDGGAGYEVLRKRRDDIHVVLTDLVMPGVGGVEFCRMARRFAPDLPVVVMSGYPLEAEALALTREGITEWIAKPFSREKVAAALARALAEPVTVKLSTSSPPRPP